MAKKPNILMFICDQLAWRALPYYGGTWADTPNIDRIAQAGAGFDQCYCSFPLCQPSRASFWTGRYPHETKVLSNGRHWPCEPVAEDLPTVGSVFSAAGYRTIHFGKTHDCGALRGFTCVPVEPVRVEAESPAWPVSRDTFNDVDTGNKAAAWLREAGEEPYFAVVDLNNPHDICSWIGAFRDDTPIILPEGELPPLPENFRFDDLRNRPLPVQYICCSHNRQAQTGLWDETKYRCYLAAYYHFLHRADAEIGKVLTALDSRPDRDNTILVFMADNGDGMAARRKVTKQVDFYEEGSRVPFLFAGPGIRPGAPLSGYPTSTLDLFPTLCSLVGLQAPAGLRGCDLSPALRGEEFRPARNYVASEWHTEWGFTVSPGRMVTDGRYKYTYYIEDGGEELFDLERDPLEQHNAARDPACREALETMRATLREQLESTGDDFLSLEWKADPMWRSHEPGYEHHRGDAAPDYYEPAAVFFAKLRAEGKLE